MLAHLFLLWCCLGVQAAVSEDALQKQEKASIVPLKDVTEKLAKEGWITKTILGEALPVGLDRKELADGVEVDSSWIVNQAVPVRSVTLRKGVEEEMLFEGLSIEERTEVAVPLKDSRELILKLPRTPRRIDDPRSKNSMKFTFKAPANDKEIKVYFVERVIKIRIRGVEQQFFTGSATIVIFEKKKQKQGPDK